MWFRQRSRSLDFARDDNSFLLTLMWTHTACGFQSSGPSTSVAAAIFARDDNSFYCALPPADAAWVALLSGPLLELRIAGVDAALICGWKLGEADGLILRARLFLIEDVH
jgi:hypothetical protein